MTLTLAEAAHAALFDPSASAADGARRSYSREKGRRSGEPVRRHSRIAGREGVFWRSTNRQEVRRIMLAARRYELATRQPGARSGALGFVALEVLELFGNLVDFRTGRLEPSIETLMRYLKRSRDAVVRALKALRDHGFLDWLRRYVPTGAEQGPQVKQTSNAYRLFLPKAAARRAPEPLDISAAEAELDRLMRGRVDG